jgi:peroxiredoxin
MITWHQCLCNRLKAGLVTTMVTLALTGSIGLAGSVCRGAAEEPADAPLPEISPAQLAAKLREAIVACDDIGTFRVVFTETRDLNDQSAINRGTPEEQKPVLVSFRGRARYESDGTRWRAEYDSMTQTYGSTQLRPDRWSSGFDGARRYDWQVSNNHFILGESSPSARQWAPRSIIWERYEELVRMLEGTDRDRQSIAIAQRVTDGIGCYVVESKMPDGQWGGETIISPRQGYLPIGRQWTNRGRIYSSRSLRGVREVVPGIWAPEHIEEETSTIREDGVSRLDMRRRIQVVEYRPRQISPAAAFQVAIPHGVDLIDRPAGFSYHIDPWWPEVGAMLGEKFGWPLRDFSPLTTLGSRSERKLDGQTAPRLRIASWLNTKPMDLAALRGKVVLVKFGNIRDTYDHRCETALRELYSLYHPAGLEIVSIHVPADDVDEIRHLARDYRLPYPVVIDEGKPGSMGKTAEAFAIRGRICAFVIDHEGKIHSAGKPTGNGGGVVETLVSLLKKSGARDLKAVSLERPRLPDGAFKAADALFQTLVKEALDADPQGKILGRIVDGDHRPVAGASVRATLYLRVTESTYPLGTWYTIGYRALDERFGARSEVDGRFELSGLCKGGYVLKVESPGRAWLERKVFVAPDLDPVSVELVLDQGDAISGQIRDPQGKPIANASVTPTWRQHFEDGEFRYSSNISGLGLTTGEAGRFRLTGLQHGRYLIEVKAAGFKDRKLEPIPVGDGNVVVTLERSP